MTSTNHWPKQYFGEDNGAQQTEKQNGFYQPSSALEHADAAASTRLRLYIAEEQQILREAYQSFFLPHPGIEVVGTSGDTSPDALIGAAAALKPRVMLLGFKILKADTVARLDRVREANPDVGIVMLSASYDVKGIKGLREFSRGTSVGCAYLLKHAIDTVDQLTQVVMSVSEGRIILDPTVMDGLITSTDPGPLF